MREGKFEGTTPVSNSEFNFVHDLFCKNLEDSQQKFSYILFG